MTNFIILILLLACGSSEKKNHIYWKSEIDLKIADFQAKVRSDSRKAAISSIGFENEFISKPRKGLVKFSIKVFFDKDKSWIKNGYKNDYTLRHETYHFHIAELFARKLRKKVLKDNLTRMNYNEKFNVIFKNIHSDYLKFQERYDIETGFQESKEDQMKWQQKIDTELELYTKYKNPIVDIPYK